VQAPTLMPTYEVDDDKISYVQDAAREIIPSKH
jgi:hypothetical protein